MYVGGKLFFALLTADIPEKTRLEQVNWIWKHSWELGPHGPVEVQ